MNRAVTAEDGREWVIRAQMEWRPPATADDFEHDVAGSYVPGVVMMVLAVILAVTLITWMPPGVVVPAWVPLSVLLIALFFPLRWVLRRPWTIVAETNEQPHIDQAAERWVGTVRGMFAVRSQVNNVAKSIELHALPDFDGPLYPVE